MLAPLLDRTNFSFGADPKQSACAVLNCVLFLSIDYYAIVRCGGAKMVAQPSISVVSARGLAASLDAKAQDFFAVQSEHKTKFVVMGMTSLATYSIGNCEEKNFSLLRPDDSDSGFGEKSDSVWAGLVRGRARTKRGGLAQAIPFDERRFKLAPETPVAVEGGELVIRFTYEPNPKKQRDLNAAAEERILATADVATHDWIRALGQKHVRADGTESDDTRLRVHLDRYTARNTFDYFIHKDLGGFLRRELDFYIKNEVMHLDDVEHETAPRAEQYLSKLKVIRSIAGKISASSWRT